MTGADGARTGGGRLDGAARAHLKRLVAGVDALAPGRLEGLYLYGSAALKDFRPGKSDVDFAAVSSAPWPNALLPALARLHREAASARPSPSLDGLYVTWHELGRDPERARAPHALAGEFRASGAFDANWAVWETIARYGVPVRGPARPRVARDARGLRRFCVANLGTYWRALAESAATREPSDPARPDADAEALVWCAAGVLRLAYTVATGDVTSKAGALGWALAQPAYAPWRSLLARALVLREGGARGGAEAMPTAAAGGLGAFMLAVIDRAAGAGGPA